MSTTTTTTAAAPKIATSLAAACDNTQLPGDDSKNKMGGSIENVEAYILANAPLKYSNNNNNASSSPADTNEENAKQLDKMIQMLVYRDGEGRTALHWSIALKNFDLARSLLEVAAKVNSEMKKSNNDNKGSENNNNDNNSLLFIAPWCLPPDGNSTTVLATACAVSAPLELISDLIFQATGMQSSVSSPQQSNQNQQQSKAMMTSTSSSSSQQQHPFISTPDAQGNTALHLAASRGNIKLVSYLVNNFSADPREQNKKGQTTLHRIVARGDTSSVEELLILMRRKYPMEVKKFVNCVDKNGDTALHYASMEENREIGEFLLRNGADRNIKNKNGKEFWQL